MIRGTAAAVAAVGIGAGLIVAPASAAPAPPAASIPLASGLSTGEWSGTLTVYALASVGGLGTNRTSGTGIISALDSPDGVSGDWSLEMNADLRVTADSGLPTELRNVRANIVTGGALTGTSDRTVMDPTGVSITLQQLGSFTVGPEYQLRWLLQATSVGCTQVTGDFVQNTRDLAPAFGIDFRRLSGTYSMTKDATVPADQRAEFERRLRELNAEFIALFDALPEGGDLAGLANLLEDAERLGRQRQGDAACISGGAIENLLAGEVGTMLGEFVNAARRGAGASPLSAADWNRLTTAARRTGVFQSELWASGPKRAQLAGVLADLIAAEIDRLGGPDDAAAVAALAQLGLAATAAGLPTEAAAAFGAVR